MKNLGHLTDFWGWKSILILQVYFLINTNIDRIWLLWPVFRSLLLVDTPLEVKVKYHRGESDLLYDPTMFQQLLGSLNYLTITKSDISFVVQQISPFMQSPRPLHLATMCRIFCKSYDVIPCGNHWNIIERSKEGHSIFNLQICSFLLKGALKWRFIQHNWHNIPWTIPTQCLHRSRQEFIQP